ncbi:MAG: SDR family oxidoreductase [Alphaproteobacteria bacterium]|nr:SDR family oxidoreductase [Alphaproteobacteria bacterium]
MSLFDLTGQVAVVTGSTKGIGKAIAMRMAEHGAKVVVSSRKAEACDKVAAEIRAQGGEAIPVPCNISRKEELETLVKTALKTWGKIDSLVCNAAVNPYYGPTLKMPDEAFQKTINANLLSKIWLCNLVIPQMAERKDGSVILVSSVGGFKGSADIGLYCITKAADLQLARNLAMEWGPKNIRVNCIAPGLIRTDMARALWENPEIYKRSTRGAPLGRIGEPDEIAGGAVFMASAAGRFMTGQALVIDGGALISGGGSAE